MGAVEEIETAVVGGGEGVFEGVGGPILISG